MRNGDWHQAFGTAASEQQCDRNGDQKGSCPGKAGQVAAGCGISLLWNFFGIVCTETAAEVFWVVLLLQQYQGKMVLHADVKWVIIKRRLKMQKCPDMTQVSCISKGLQVPAKSLEFGFFKSTF